MEPSMFTGSLVAIVTPFKNGKLDERTLGDLIEWQISRGTHGIVPCGTTGESATLTHAEHERVVAFTVEVVRRRVPVVAAFTGVRYTDGSLGRILRSSARGMRRPGSMHSRIRRFQRSWLGLSIFRGERRRGFVL